MLAVGADSMGQRAAFPLFYIITQTSPRVKSNIVNDNFDFGSLF